MKHLKTRFRKKKSSKYSKKYSRKISKRKTRLVRKIKRKTKRSKKYIKGGDYRASTEASRLKQKSLARPSAVPTSPITMGEYKKKHPTKYPVPVPEPEPEPEWPPGISIPPDL